MYIKIYICIRTMHHVPDCMDNICCNYLQDLNKNLKISIKVERARQGFTHSDLAEKVGVTRLTIHSIETGKFNPSVILALKIAACFGMPVEELFELENDD